MSVFNQSVSGFKALFWGILTGWIIYFLGSTLVGICYFFSDLSDTILPLLVYLILFIAVLTTSALTSSRIGSRGWFWGMLSGGILFVLLMLEMRLASEWSAWGTILLKMLVCLLGGTLGGILGVGQKKPR